MLKKKVIKIKKKGKILIDNKKRNLLSLKLNFISIFFINKNNKKKNGMSIPNCFNKKVIGYFKWLKISVSSSPDLCKPYVTVIKLLSNNQSRCGTKRTKKISIIIKYLKSKFLNFL